MVRNLQEPDGPWEPDEEIADERYLAAAVKGKGVVVLSACSHAGGGFRAVMLQERYVCQQHSTQWHAKGWEGHAGLKAWCWA